MSPENTLPPPEERDNERNPGRTEAIKNASLFYDGYLFNLVNYMNPPYLSTISQEEARVYEDIGIDKDHLVVNSPNEVASPLWLAIKEIAKFKGLSTDDLENKEQFEELVPDLDEAFELAKSNLEDEIVKFMPQIKKLTNPLNHKLYLKLKIKARSHIKDEEIIVFSDDH